MGGASSLGVVSRAPLRPSAGEDPTTFRSGRERDTGPPLTGTARPSPFFSWFVGGRGLLFTEKKELRLLSEAGGDSKPTLSAGGRSHPVFSVSPCLRLRVSDGPWPSPVQFWGGAGDRPTGWEGQPQNEVGSKDGLGGEAME